MRFNDPSRPQNMPGSFMYLSPSGKPIAVLPSFLIKPLDVYTCDVSMMLLVAPSTASWFEKTVQTDDLPQLFALWMENPEDVLLKLFGYSYEPSASVPKAAILSLEDLGL